jgi:hypothetical protein
MSLILEENEVVGDEYDAENSDIKKRKSQGRPTAQETGS